MNSCHEEGVRDRNRARTEAADPAASIPARFRSRTPSSLNSDGVKLRLIPGIKLNEGSFEIPPLRMFLIKTMRNRDK
eukprot:gene16408-biopygen499